VRGARPLAALEASVAEGVAARPGDVLLAAVSGGPDSVALAALLGRCVRQAGATLALAHVNHALREGAWQDEGVVLALGAALGVRVIARSLALGSAAEARLRDERYAALAEIARGLGARRIFTAHHAQDQTETVLLALFRGTGPDGLLGLPSVRELPDGIVVERPLLGIEPAALRAYCASEHLAYAVDPSNGDLAYRRNAVRAALVDLRASFPHLDAAVARCADILRAERAAAPRAALRERLRVEVRAAAGDTRDVPFERLDAVARALERGTPGRHFLRRGVEAIVE